MIQVNSYGKEADYEYGRVMDSCLLQLVERFQFQPLDYFHERELHCEFFRLSREAIGSEQTLDGYPVYLLRHEYNTVWRYFRSGVSQEKKFAKRYEESGKGSEKGPKVGAIDFVLLRRDFVREYDYLTVMNKEEALRCRLRVEPWEEYSRAIDRAVEFKMTHVHCVGPPPWQPAVRFSDFNVVSVGMPTDCRKLAGERVRIAYLVAFSHHTYENENWFNQNCVEAMFGECVREWRRCYDGPNELGIEHQLRLLLVMPNLCFRWGNWEVQFPNEKLIEIQ
jgi:hypothetical protein